MADEAFQTADGRSLSKKQRKLKRLNAMRGEYTSFRSEHMTLARFVSPRRGRFQTQDRNKGGNRYGSIINTTASMALRTAQAGLLSGVASPARPWFMLETDDPDLREFLPVKVWLKRVEQLIRDILNDSNFYSQAPVLFGEMLTFATGAMIQVNDFEDVSRFYTPTIGSYYIAQDERQKINSFAREIEMTVEQLYGKFGKRGGGADNSHFSTYVRNAYSRGDYDQWVPVVHMVEPNSHYMPESKLSKNFQFSSCYFEKRNEDKRDVFLDMKGHKLFPVHVPRWATTAEDIWGTDCPAMIALGDVKQLQSQEKEKGKAIQKMVSPPLHGPPALNNVAIAGLPGGSTIYDAPDGRHVLRPVHEVDPRIAELRQDMNAVEMRIKEAFYVDLFLAITNMEGIQPRNEFEIAQRNQERLLQLGPVLERLHGEFLVNVIDRIFYQCVEAGILPQPIPQALQDKDLKIKFVSTLAMAQKAVATGSINELYSFASGLAKSGWPEALKKVDALQGVDEYAAATGVLPNLVKTDEQVQKEIQAEQQMQQRMQMMQFAQAGAKAAKDMSGVSMEPNSLTGAVAEKAKQQMGG